MRAMALAEKEGGSSGTPAAYSICAIGVQDAQRRYRTPAGQKVDVLANMEEEKNRQTIAVSG
jgi:hypothetical protein